MGMFRRMFFSRMLVKEAQVFLFLGLITTGEKLIDRYKIPNLPWHVFSRIRYDGSSAVAISN